LKSNYRDTEKYWGEVFEEQEAYNPHQKLPYKKIEDALKWLCKNNSNIIDLGCGDGLLSGRCLDYGVENICGIDLSAQAIDLAKKVMKSYNLQSRSTFICGNVKELYEIEDESYNGAILSNIIDNILPADTDKILEEIYRILKLDGKVFIKLNPYYQPEELKNSDDYTKISKNFYKEDSGLYLYNISDHLFEELINPYYEIMKKEIINFEEFNIINRIYYLKKLS